ncbi:exocyst complex component 3-like protein 4 isoform X2 [Amphiprion ocellaris]|uniref:Exocyst complex component Sec6 n=1 Tax=Amphiprion ocellaris TaxID=80972 RepID=A0A3Q1D0C2_AMPOC|nr:exocyst complex component 3-like protein 4 isoform X2 [Amphiprion ocellaris]
MSEMMDKSGENPFEDNVSVKSNGKLGVVNSLRRSIRRVAEKSPISIGGKDPKTPKQDDESASSPPPPSPNPNMSKFGDSIMKKGEQIRRSLRLTKKDNDKSSKQEALLPVSEGSMEEEKEEKVEEEELMEEMEEMDEMYELPEIPNTPLSVMQINNLIEMEVLEEAHLNLLSMRKEFQQEQQQHADDDSPMELAKKEKDLSLLYGNLRKKMGQLVRDSNSLPSRNKALLVLVARIIQEEEKRAEEPGGLPDSWMEAWREAVDEGVKAKVERVHLEKREQNDSWLAVHLGHLGKAIVDDLENVKKELRWSYPPSFKVFSTYVRSYHRVVGQHLKKLEVEVTEQKDLYALLYWILNRYKSDKIMGSLSLQPDMQAENSDLQLEDEFLKQLKEKYCRKVKEGMRSSLDRIIELEDEEVWSESKALIKEENILKSPFPMDIWTNIKSNAVNSGKVEAQLEVKVLSSCLEELKHFPSRFESEFRRRCSALRPQPLWTEYHIAYINSFTCLQEHMEGYEASCPGEVEGLKKEVKGLVVRLMEVLEEQFKEDVKPYLRRMMTRKWLNDDDDFKHLYSRTNQLSQHCGLMTPPHVQGFAGRLHLHVVKQYIGQLMMNNYSCKNRKHEKAAAKIRQQWNQLRDLFEEMESPHEWLHAVGDDLSNIIGQKSKMDIQNHLQPLVKHYPDFSKKHLVAVLYFRGLMRGREHQQILQKLSALKKEPNTSGSDRNQVLFGDMQVTVNTDCFSNLPFSCFSFWDN